MRPYAAALLASVASVAAAQAPAHPLDGLSAREHWAIYDVMVASGRTDSTTRYLYTTLREPPKAQVLAWRPGLPIPRAGFVHFIQNKKGYEAVVDITNKRIVSWSEIPARQQMASAGDSELATELALKDQRVLAALATRGITDRTHVSCGSNLGYLDAAEERTNRVVHATCDDGRNRFSGYGAPLEGLVVVIDLTAGKVLRVVDTGARPATGPVGDHDAEAVGPVRAMRNPVAMVQPLGPSYDLKGHEVSWQNWKFHFRVDPRRGIVLSMVRYTDGGRDRSVMYQGSLSELFVPYMDPSDPWNYQGFFDLGTYPALFRGIASTLEPGVECPAYGTTFNTVVVTSRGRPVETPRAVCLFERSAGDVSWRHGRDGDATIETRAKRDLVLRMFMVAGNYDYLFDWVFQQDGTLRVNVGATGMDQVKAAAGTPADGDYGRVIAPNLVGINHSHFFSFRLDLDVDGTANSLVVDKLVTERQPEANPRRSLWRVQSQTARTETDAQRHSTMTAPEVWRIVNPGVTGAYGAPVGYQVDGHSSLTLLSPDDYMQRRAGFTNHTLWITPHNATELFAAGDYPTMSVADDGLPKWTAANRPIANTDLVAWLTLGFHHVPRPEDWPIMPVAWHGFELRPVGFFSRNPAIDLPRTP